MLNLNYDRIFSNVKLDTLLKIGGDASLEAHWYVMKDLKKLALRVKARPHSIVLWRLGEVNVRTKDLLEAIQLHALTYFILDAPPSGVVGARLKMMDSQVLMDDQSLKRTLDRTSLALRPGAWQLPVEVRYEKDVNELIVTFANGDKVAWDVLKWPEYEWERAFVDIEEEPFAVGVYKKGLKRPVFLSSLDIRRETGTLPPKSEYPHALDAEDVERRAKEYGAFLKSKADAEGFTQERLAAGMGVSREQLSRVFNGHHFPRASTLKRMAETLGLKFKDLLQDRGNNEPGLDGNLSGLAGDDVHARIDSDGPWKGSMEDEKSATGVPSHSERRGQVMSMKEPGLDGRYRDQLSPKQGEIRLKRGDTLNKNLPQPIPGFSGNAKLETMRKETGKVGINAVRKAAKKIR